MTWIFTSSIFWLRFFIIIIIIIIIIMVWQDGEMHPHTLSTLERYGSHKVC